LTVARRRDDRESAMRRLVEREPFERGAVKACSLPICDNPAELVEDRLSGAQSAFATMISSPCPIDRRRLKRSVDKIGSMPFSMALIP
jgi:hypothetical protein